jgi:hypothetical protein
MLLFNKNNTYVLIVCAICLSFYLGVFTVNHYSPNLDPQLNYFRYLADAFNHGRLNLENTPSKEDLVEFNHQFYAYWPPVPALVYMPLVALFGMQLPDALINTLFAVFNILLVMKITVVVNKRFNCLLKIHHIALLGLFWGLGTVQFYMARSGAVWQVSQIMAQTFLLLAIYTFISITAMHKRLFFAGFFFACAVYTRNHFLLAFPFFIGYELASNSNFKWRTIIKTYGLFIVPFFVFSLLNAYYNYARFGDCFENGLQYHLMSDYFKNVFIQHGYFSLEYFSHNFYTEVLHWPSLKMQFPFIEREPEGFGFIWGSPIYLLLIPALILFFKNKLSAPNRTLISACLISVFLMSTVIFSIMGTGWVQFCARYTLDFQFFLVLIILLLWPQLSKLKWTKPIAILLILGSIGIQYLGAYYLN